MCPELNPNLAPPNFNPTALPLHKSVHSAVTHCRVPFQFHPKHTLFFVTRLFHSLAPRGSVLFGQFLPRRFANHSFIRALLVDCVKHTHSTISHLFTSFIVTVKLYVLRSLSGVSKIGRQSKEMQRLSDWPILIRKQAVIFPPELSHKPVLFPLQVSNNTNDHFLTIHLKWIVL